MQTHQLSSEETDIITAILDDAERNLDIYGVKKNSLSMLDEQCREIWPNWDSASQKLNSSRSPPYRSSFSPNRQNISNETLSESIMNIDSNNTPSRMTVANVDIPNGSPIGKQTSPKSSNSDKQSVKSSQYSSKRNFDLYSKNTEVEEMKKDIDALYFRIHSPAQAVASTKEPKESPTGSSNKNSPQNITPTRRNSPKLDNTFSLSSTRSEIQRLQAENDVLRLELDKMKALVQAKDEQILKLQTQIRRSPFH